MYWRQPVTMATENTFTNKGKHVKGMGSSTYLSRQNINSNDKHAFNKNSICFIIQVKLNFTLEQSMKTQKGSRVTSVLCLLTKALDRVGDQHHVTAALPLGKYSARIVQGTGWAPRPFWTGVEVMKT
jgi:hypothetical protein